MSQNETEDFFCAQTVKYLNSHERPDSCGLILGKMARQMDNRKATRPASFSLSLKSIFELKRYD